MSWIFWVAILGWVIPFVVRKMSQGAQGRDRFPPYRQDRYGQPPQGQPPQGPYPQGPGWWQQPLPPDFPGQPQQQPDQSQPDQSQPDQPAPGTSAQPAPGPQPSPAESVPPGAPDDAPQGYRAKKLAELDRQFSEQKISLEEYMKARNEVMRG